MLAAAWLRVLIQSAMENQDRQRNQMEFLFQSLVGADHCGHSLGWLSLMGNQRIIVHCLDYFGIAREPLVRKVKHMCVWSDVAQPFENRESEVGRGQFMRKAFAYQPRQLGLMVEGVKAGDNAACAVTEEEHWQAWLPQLYGGRDRFHIMDVVFKSIDVEALAVRLAATSEIYCVHGYTVSDELFGHPLVITAMSVEARDNYYYAMRRCDRTPGPKKDVPTLTPSTVSSVGISGDMTESTGGFSSASSHNLIPKAM